MTKQKTRALDERARQRVDAEIARMQAHARELHPERYAPDGTELIRYAGQDWFERLNSWRRANGQAEIERVHEMHPQPTPPERINTYSDDKTREVPI